MRYLLTLDGGGTKTDGLLLCQQSGQRWTARAGAAQLTNDFAAAIHHVRELSLQLCQQANARPADVSAIFGLAGAGNPQLAEAFNQAQQIPFAHWQLTTDARTSLYGANLGPPVVVVAIVFHESVHTFSYINLSIPESKQFFNRDAHRANFLVTFQKSARHGWCQNAGETDSKSVGERDSQ